MSGDISGCHTEERDITSVQETDAKILLNIQQRTGQLPPIKNHLDPSVSNAKIEKPSPNVHISHYHGSFVESQKPTWGHSVH